LGEITHFAIFVLKGKGRRVSLQFWNSKVATLLLCLVADNGPERLQETDDEGIERDSGEGDDESSTSPHHVTLSKVIDVSNVPMSALTLSSSPSASAGNARLTNRCRQMLQELGIELL
jgi:hypothetical protein